MTDGRGIMVGVDSGGSKTRAVIVDSRLEIVGSATAGPAGLSTVGVRGVAGQILAALDGALRGVGAEADRSLVTLLAVGAAGAGRQAERQRLEAALRQALPGVRIVVAGDAECALMGATAGQPGLLVVAGTGSIVLAQGPGGVVARAGGWGPLLGDDGGGFGLGREALRVALGERDRGEAASPLARAVLNHYRLDSISSILSHIQEGSAPQASVAELAPEVLRLADQGDEAAVVIRAQAVEALVAGARLAMKRAGLAETGGASSSPGAVFPYFLWGGLMADTGFRDLLRAGLARAFPAAVNRKPLHEPAVGAVMLALRRESGEAASGGSGADVPLDQLTTGDLLRRVNEEDATVAAAVGEAIPDVVRAVDLIAARLAEGGRLFYVGAGTSGRLGVLDAAECPPTFGTWPDLVQAIMAGGDEAVFAAREGAEDSAGEGRRAVACRAVSSGDAVVGITAGGRTPFTLGALAEAGDRGAATIAVVCRQGSPLAESVDVLIEALVGSEIIRGSTRLKAGTAQKLILNMISTAVMVRLGRVYGNLMVALKPSNEKLRERALGIVAEICGVGETAAREALEGAHWDVRVAVLCIERGLDPDEAGRLLDSVGGSLRRALRRRDSREEEKQGF